MLLEEQEVVSLWYHSLSSLEEAVLSLMECVLPDTGYTPQELKRQLAQSLLVGTSFVMRTQNPNLKTIKACVSAIDVI